MKKMDRKKLYELELEKYNKGDKEILINAKIALNHSPNLKVLLILTFLTILFLIFGIVTVFLYVSVIDKNFIILYETLFIIFFAIAFILLLLSTFIFLKRSIYLKKVEDYLIKLKIYY